MNHLEVQRASLAWAGALATTAMLCASCGGGGGADPPSTLSPVTQPSPPPAVPNRTPIVLNPVPDQRGGGERPFDLDLTQTFQDPDGDTLRIVRASSSPSGAVGISSTPLHVSGRLPADGSFMVTVAVSDSRGGEVETSFRIDVTPNAVPTATNPNFAVYVQPGIPLSYDPTKGGQTFSDGDGDALTYELTMASPSRGLAVSNGRVIGLLSDIGVVYFDLKATDVVGATATDRFAIAVAAPEPPEPILPSSTYIYADDQLQMPLAFAISAAFPPGMFWDTQPDNNRTSNAGATLGRVLFYDKRLSVTRTHSCGSCHQQSQGFSSPERFDVGTLGTPLKRHSMALSNVRFNVPELWFSDMRAAPLERLALMPIEDQTELGSFVPQLETTLAATSFYPQLFAAAFGDRQITGERIGRAIAQFLRSLTSYRSKFDLVYHGANGPQEQLLTPQELRGRILFTGELPCRFCHSNGVQTMNEAFSNGLDPVITDPGVNHLEGPTGRFRAPSLRNVAASAPYMHDGRFSTLREVIDHYDSGVLESRALSATLREGLHWSNPPVRMHLSESDKQALEAFLHTLTDNAFLTDPKFSDPFE
jgi:cytochrome c peroxidase